jgi:hypothetical protein
MRIAESQKYRNGIKGTRNLLQGEIVKLVSRDMSAPPKSEPLNG